MTVHSHLYSSEVIGYNNGYTISSDSMDDDSEGIKHIIFIHESYPCKALEGTGVDRSKTVEMDSESGHKAQRLAEFRG